MRIKILQWNVQMGINHFPIIKIITEEQPDIMCFQEATHNPAGGVGYFGFTERLREQCPDYEFWFHAPMLTMTCHGETVYDGLLMASKIPLEDYNVLPLETGYRFAKPDTLEAGMTFCAQFARVMTPTPFILINHHGYIDGVNSADKSGTPTTDDHARRILNHAQSMGDRIVYCCDMNVTPDSTTVKLATQTLRDHVSEAGITTTRPATVTIPPHVCDYVFTSPDISLQSLRVMDRAHELCSDHLGIIAEIEV